MIKPSIREITSHAAGKTRFRFVKLKEESEKNRNTSACTSDPHRTAAGPGREVKPKPRSRQMTSLRQRSRCSSQRLPRCVAVLEEVIFEIDRLLETCVRRREDVPASHKFRQVLGLGVQEPTKIGDDGAKVRA